MRDSTCLAAGVLALSLTAAACGDGDPAHLEATLLGPSQVQAQVVMIQPSVVVPSFVPGRTCATLPAFQTQFTMFFTTDRDLIGRGLNLSFIDRTGFIVPSTMFHAAFVGTTAPNAPVNIPNTPAVPVPSSLPFFGMPVQPRSNFVIVVNFDCGVLPFGTLSVEAETADSAGITTMSRATIRVAQ
jgi:hypothetical protein